MITRISFIQSMSLTDVLVVKNPKEDEQLIKKLNMLSKFHKWQIVKGKIIRIT